MRLLFCSGGGGWVVRAKKKVRVCVCGEKVRPSVLTSSAEIRRDGGSRFFFAPGRSIANCIVDGCFSFFFFFFSSPHFCGRTFLGGFFLFTV